MFVVTGTNDEEMGGGARTATKQQIAFYGSTPAYRGGARAARLGRPRRRAQHACRSAGEWVEMGELITDEMLDTFAVVAEPDERRRPASAPASATLVDRISFDLPYRADPDASGPIIAELKDVGYVSDAERGGRAANAAFYAALEACDLDAMAEVWEHSDRVVGDASGVADAPRLGARRAARGTRSSATPASSSSCSPTSRCTVAGDAAWVTADENILQAAGEPTSRRDIEVARPRSRTSSCTTASAG